MGSYQHGYDEERFQTEISRNFICSICFNVLRDPVLCPRNQHCFCRSCITKFLENSQRCPTCADELTVETLTEPQRMLKDYLNELNIHCKHVNRGCHEIVQLQHLDHHEATCGFSPAVCANQGCGVIVNKRDLIHHESELCEFRKLKCHSCGEMTKTLRVMGNRIKSVEAKLTNIQTNMANLERSIDKNISDIKVDMERNFEAGNNEMRGFIAALIEGFNELREVFVNIERTKEESPRKMRGRASGDKNKENIVATGNGLTDSVGIFTLRQNLRLPSADECSVGISSGDERSVHTLPCGEHSVRVSSDDEGSVRNSSGDERGVRVSSADESSVRVSSGDERGVRVSSADEGSVRVSSGDECDVRVSSGNEGCVRVSSGHERSVHTSSGDEHSVHVSSGEERNARVSSGDQRGVRTRLGNERSGHVSSGDEHNVNVSSGNQRAQGVLRVRRPRFRRLFNRQQAKR